MTFLRNAYLVARRDFLVWRHYWKSSLIGTLGAPVFYLLALGYGIGALVPGSVDGMDYLVFLGLALPLTSAATQAGMECTYDAFTRMDRQRTYHAIIATPIAIEEVVFGEILWAAAHAAISAAATILALAVFGVVADAPTLGAALLLSGAVGAALGAAGLVATGLARDYDHFSYFHGIAVPAVMLLSGAFFPVDVLAPPLAALARALPLTPAVSAVRGVFRGDPSGVLPALAISAAWAVPLGLIAAGLIRRRVLR